jgi:MFS family permease
LSLVFPILEKKWAITGFEESLLGSLVFTGYMIGSLFSGKASDIYGRRKPLLISSILMFAVALYCGFSFDFWFFMIFRILFGMIVGFCVPISFTMLAECSPVK